jgi:predicted aspartyl protease
MKTRYDNGYAPPAPCLSIRLTVPDEPFRSQELKVLVDTGADATIVPAQYVEPLGVQIDNRKVLRSPWGGRQVVDVYLLDVEIGDQRLPLIEIVADEQGEEAILGRNVLNRLFMVLNGPKLTLEI